jgi:hypothetical protein
VYKNKLFILELHGVGSAQMLVPQIFSQITFSEEKPECQAD